MAGKTDRSTKTGTRRKTEEEKKTERDEKSYLRERETERHLDRNRKTKIQRQKTQRATKRDRKSCSRKGTTRCEYDWTRKGFSLFFSVTSWRLWRAEGDRVTWTETRRFRGISHRLEKREINPDERARTRTVGQNQVVLNHSLSHEFGSG